MADTSVSFKCPNCGGPLAYKPGQGEKIKCEYCETEFDVETLEKLYAQSREEAAAAEKAQESQWKPEEAGSDWQERITMFFSVFYNFIQSIYGFIIVGKIMHKDDIASSFF